jgi:hypothetical protein
MIGKSGIEVSRMLVDECFRERPCIEHSLYSDKDVLAAIQLISDRGARECAAYIGVPEAFAATCIQ